MSVPDLSSHCDIHASDLSLRGFKVYAINTSVSRTPVYSRRDYYKICILTGQSNLHYADRSIELSGTSMFFSNPYVPYSSEMLSDKQTGYACLFTEKFLKANDRSESLQESPLFKIGNNPVFHLDDAQKIFAESIFQKMLDEQQTDYIYKNDLIRNYLGLLIHEAMKMRPAEHYTKHRNASERVTTLFMQLLERQFPIESTGHPLKFRTAQDYATNLSIHVNHLNRAVKEVTGKPTTAHITDRIISEARALLQHTDWSISEIAYALGFEYPTYFNNYFKRLTGVVPTSLRSAAIV